MNKTQEGYVPTPRIEVVEIPNYISTRSAWEVRVNGNHAGRWDKQEQAELRAEEIRSWFKPPEEANKRLKVVQTYMVVDPVRGASWSSESWTREDAEAEAERLEKIWRAL